MGWAGNLGTMKARKIRPGGHLGSTGRPRRRTVLTIWCSRHLGSTGGPKRRTSRLAANHATGRVFNGAVSR